MNEASIQELSELIDSIRREARRINASVISRDADRADKLLSDLGSKTVVSGSKNQFSRHTKRTPISNGDTPLLDLG